MGYYDSKLKEFLKKVESLSKDFDVPQLQRIKNERCNVENLPRMFDLIIEISESMVSKINSLQSELKILKQTSIDQVDIDSRINK